MLLFRNQTNPLFIPVLLGCVVLSTLGFQGIRNQVLAQKNQPSKKPDKILQVNPSELTPTYPAKAPPQKVNPLPDERQRQENVGEVNYRIGALQADYTGNLWVGSWRGLTRIDPNTGKILARVRLPNLTIGDITQDKVGRLWVGTYGGLKRIDPRSSEITAQNLFLPSKRVLSLLIDKRGYLWVGTDNGLALISPDQGLLMTTLQKLPGVSSFTLIMNHHN